MKKLIKHSVAHVASFIKMYVDAAKKIDSKKPLKVVDYQICSKTGMAQKQTILVYSSEHNPTQNEHQVKHL